MFKYLWETSWSTIIWIVAAGIGSGLSNAGLIATINKAIYNRSENVTLFLSFICLSVAVISTEVLASILAGRLGENSIYKLRLELCQLILNAPYPVLHKLGKSKLLANLTNDIPVISSAFTLFPEICIHFAIFIGCMTYLSILSWKIALMLLILITIGTAIYKGFINLARKTMEQSREEYDGLYMDFCALTEGIKELVLNKSKSIAFMDEALSVRADGNRKLSLSARNLYVLADKYIFILYYTIVGLIAFVLPNDIVSQEIISGYILVLLYMAGHVSALARSISVFTGAKISLNKISEIGGVLKKSVCNNIDIHRELSEFQSIYLEDVTHSFYNEKENSNFVLGPINLCFESGELIFLIGGNGSGKTTLAMLLLGLFLPENGVIRFNGIDITDNNRNEYMQNFSAVFSDFYLFDTLFGVNWNETNNRLTEYLKRLHLHHKVKIDDGKFSTLELSQGQRKRLALLVAYLEDRPFYVFDEWAADQDPEFKNIFYNELLPELKANGKTVLVITHDDKFFHLADRCVKLEDGQVKDNWYQNTVQHGDNSCASS